MRVREHRRVIKRIKIFKIIMRVKRMRGIGYGVY